MITFKHTKNAPSGGWGLHINILLISAFLLGGCTTEEPKQPITPDPISVEQPALTITDGILGIYKDFPLDQSIVASDTVINKPALKLHTPPATAPDLTALKNNDDPDLKGKPHRYVAVGGSLTAGVRDGGLYQEAQQTSFPNLIARQMKIQFRQPLFGDTEYNGYGYKTIGHNPFGTGIPYYNMVKNNTAIKSRDKYITLNKYVGEIDNFGVPFSFSYQLNLYGWIDTSYRNEEPVKVFQDRFLTTGNVSRFDPPAKINALSSQKFDFFTLEMGLDDITNKNGGFGGFLLNGAQGIIPPNFIFLQHAKKINAKGLIINVPDALDFPYYNLVTLAQIKKGLGKDIVYKGGPEAIEEGKFLFLPTSAIDSILNTKNQLKKRGSSYDYPLLGLISKRTWADGVKMSNTAYEKWSKEFNYPIVDLYTLFKKIASGNYVTVGGTKVTNTFRTGNFFSSDGIRPSAFGQAIIANECIRTFNAFYKTNIPLISEEEYLAK